MKLVEKIREAWRWWKQPIQKSHRYPACHRCGTAYSDWFVWPPGGRYCFICWSNGCRDDDGNPWWTIYYRPERPTKRTR